MLITGFGILIFNHFNMFLYLEPIAIGIITITFATFYYLGTYSKYGDFSYGIYIVHFPIIQLLYSLNIVNDYPIYFFSGFLEGALPLSSPGLADFLSSDLPAGLAAFLSSVFSSAS